MKIQREFTLTEIYRERVAVIGASSQIGKALIPRLGSAGYLSFRIGRQYRDTIDDTTIHSFDELTSSFTPSISYADILISLAPLPSIDVVVKMAKALGAKRIIAFGSTGRFSKIGSTSAIEREFVHQQERAERLFLDQCEALGIEWTLFRPTMIYGANADLNVSFIKLMINRFGFFPIPFGAKGSRQPVHVDDLASACILALAHKETCNKAYNLGGGEVLDFPDLVKRIFRAEQKNPILVPIPMILFFILIAIARQLPKTAFVRKEMVERMFQDMVIDNKPAMMDFGYSPRAFLNDE
jgi:nucleoside-diphosphate-sugar epimerase